MTPAPLVTRARARRSGHVGPIRGPIRRCSWTRPWNRAMLTYFHVQFAQASDEDHRSRISRRRSAGAPLISRHSHGFLQSSVGGRVVVVTMY